MIFYWGRAAIARKNVQGRNCRLQYSYMYYMYNYMYYMYCYMYYMYNYMYYIYNPYLRAQDTYK